MGGRFLASKKGNQVSFDFMKRQDEKVSASSYAFECLCVCVSVCAQPISKLFLSSVCDVTL